MRASVCVCVVTARVRRAFAAVKVWWPDDVGFFRHRTAL